ncbi:MAG: TRAP transporter small permease [Geminicoccaceae bacterium]|nr:MAG: TRAP transporter small permease [Geminicoccaceae bacterium]
MRRTLDALYLTAGYLAALFLAAIGVTIVAQVVGRMAGLTIDSTEIAGFCLAASTFLGLAYTLRHGGHIRVTLLIRFARGTARRWIELWCIGFAAAGMAYFTFWAFEFVYYSWFFRELSPGLMAVPFWIPRLGMATGLLLLTIALVDEFVAVWRGAIPSYEANAETVLGDDDAVPPVSESKP